MSKNKIVFSIGLILVVMPILGFPVHWKTFISVILGLSLISLSFSVAAKRRVSARRIKRVKDVASVQGQETPMFVDGSRSGSQIKSEVAAKEESTIDQVNS